MKKKDERYYRTVLGVSPNATQKEIRRAYLNCVKYYHPDNYEIGSLAWENANKRVVEFNEAYAYLKSGPRTTPSQPPREYAHQRQAPPNTRKPPTGGQTAEGNAYTARPTYERKVREPEISVSAMLSNYAHAVLKKYLTILVAPTSVVFSAALLALLLVLSGVLYASGTTTDHVAARIAYAFHPISGQKPYANGTLRNRVLENQKKTRLTIQTTAPEGLRDGYYSIRLWSPSPNSYSFSIFIHAGETATFELPARVAFTLQYSYGRAWYGDGHTFGPAGLQYQASGIYSVPEESETERLTETRNVIDIQIYRDRSSSVTDMQGRTQPSMRFRQGGFPGYY